MAAAWANAPSAQLPAVRQLFGAEGLAEPNWKEKKQLGDRLAQGFRLTCQLWIKQDIELLQEEAISNAPEVTPSRQDKDDKTCTSS